MKLEYLPWRMLGFMGIGFYWILTGKWRLAHVKTMHLPFFICSAKVQLSSSRQQR